MALSDMQWHEEAGRQETDGQAYGLRTLDESERASMLSRAHEFTKEHLAVILVIVVVAAVFTASQLLRTRSTEVPLNPPTVVVSGSAEPAPLSTPELIQVHVLGAVVSPGVVALPVGARVHEAIAACGGLAEEADPAELNLAAVLSDGAQVIIGVKGAPQGDVLAPNGAGMGAGESSGARINLNTASSAQLETLPGVGPVMAGRIIAWREQHGKFTTTAELQEVSGIGAKTYTQLEPYVCV
jgi:competence protein ComEA